MAENAGTIYSDVRIKLDKLKGDISQVESSFNNLGTKNKAQAAGVEDTWKKSFKGISAAGIAVTVALIGAFKKMIGTFATTEQSLANVRAVTGATAEEFDSLKKAAEQAGITTRFTAGQAADALYYLASAGFDATQSIDALDGVLLLAGATGSDLATTSETLASTISAFNLEASDASRISNVFAAAIGNSQATMDKLAISMRYVAPVASSFNQTLEGTTGLLQILYNNGFEASQAGTALRSALADLANATSPANAKLKELGVSFSEVNPQTNSYAEIIDVLNKKVTDCSDIMAIFGDRAGPALIKLIEAGKSEIEKYTAAVTDTNTAAEQYAIQNDTLAGSFDMFKSAAEGASNSLIATLAPALRSIFDGVASLLRAFTTLPDALRGLVAGAGGVAAAIGVITTAFRLLGVSVGGALLPITLIASAVAGIGIAYNEATRQQRKYTNDLKELGRSVENLNTESFKLVKEYQNLASQTDKSSIEMERQKEIADKLYALFPDLTEEVLNNAEAMNTLAIKTAQVGLEAANLNLTKVKKDIIEMNKELDAQAGKIQNNLIQAWVDVNETQLVSKLGVQGYIDELNKTKERIKAFKTEAEFTEFAKKYGVNLDAIGGGFLNLNNQINDSEAAVVYFEEQIKAFTETINKNTEAVNNNKDAVKTQAEVDAEQIAARKAAEAELTEATKRAEQEREILFISEEEKNNKLIAANKKLVESLLNVNYTGLTGEKGDQAIRAAIKLIEELEAKNKKLTETKKESEELAKEELALTEEAKDLQNEYYKTIGDINDKEQLNFIDKKEADAQKINALRTYINALIESGLIEKEAVEQLVKGLNDLEKASEKAGAITKTTMTAVNEIAGAVISTLQSAGGAAEDLIKSLISTTAEMLKQSGSAEAQVVGIILEVGLAVYDFIDGVVNENERLAAVLEQINNETRDAILRNQKAKIDQAYEYELKKIKEIEDAKLQAFYRTLSAQEIAALKAAGVIEETNTERVQRELAEAIKSGNKKEAALLRNELSIVKIRDEALEKIRIAEENYQKQVRQYEHDKAVLDRDIAVMNATINKQKALSDLPWYTSNSKRNQVAASYDTLISAISSITIPEFKTGGIVFGSGNGSVVKVAEKNTNELLLNDSPSGAAMMREFARSIADQMQGYSGGEIRVIIPLDGRVIADTVVTRINNGDTSKGLK